MKKFIIYKITCKINNKIYIGQTTETLEQRFSRHIGYQKNEHDTKFYRAIRKYGIDNFYIEELDIAKNQSELDDKELFWINKLDAVNKGYNSKAVKGKCGGDTLSNHPNKEAISEKIRQSKLGDKNPMRIYGGLKGERNGMYGKQMSNEAKLAISNKLKGRVRSEEEIRKTREALKGVPKTEEHRESLIKAKLGKDYYREVVIIDMNGNIVERFKNKSEYYKQMPTKYNVSRTFLEQWIKRRDVYTNPNNIKRFKELSNKRLLYYDELITENV